MQASTFAAAIDWSAAAQAAKHGLRPLHWHAFAQDCVLMQVSSSRQAEISSPHLDLAQKQLCKQAV